jgi:hypothetical protein
MELVFIKRRIVYGLVILAIPLVLFFLPGRSKRKDEIDNEPGRVASPGTMKKKEGSKPATPSAPQKWTLAEAKGALRRQPDNAYLQYVVLQLAKQDKALAETQAEFRWTERGRRKEVDLFGLFSGQHAVQESLQLDTMLPPDALRDKDDPPATPKEKATPLDLAKLAGPAAPSHPWAKLLAGRSPKVAELSRCVPANFYFVEFRSLNKLLDLLETGQDWSRYFFAQASLDATDQRVRQRVQRQLVLPTDTSWRVLYDTLVGQIAIAGSDLFVKEGSDTTMLFDLKSDFFRGKSDSLLEQAAKDRPDARRTSGKYLGVDYVGITTPDREISVYSAYPRPKLHVRSNSLVALKRVLEAVVGKTEAGSVVTRLGDTDEFKYVRTLLKPGEVEEDGFIYLSDPFIHEMVGPRVKLTERRRLVGYNHLRMVAHAAQLYRTQFGKAPKSLDDLHQAGVVPGEFNKDRLACPFGGTYSLSADGTAGVSSVLGTAQYLTPCCELSVKEATAEEVSAYREFVKDYNQYWRSYFDPIAIRLQVTAKRLRAETLVLPLIDNTIYTALSKALGGAPEALDNQPVPRRNLFSLNLRLDKAAVLYALYLKEGDDYRTKKLLKDSGAFTEAQAKQFVQQIRNFVEKGVGNQAGLHLYDTSIMFDVSLPRLLATSTELVPGLLQVRGEDSMTAILPTGLMAFSLAAPTYLAFSVNDAKVVDEFLATLDPLLLKFSTLRSQDSWPDFGADFTHHVSKSGVKSRCVGVRYGPFRFRFYYARVGNGLYVTNQPYVLDDLQAAATAQRPGADKGPVGHAMMRLRPRNWNLALPGYNLGWAENNREASMRNLSMLNAAARAFSSTPPVWEQAPTQEDRQRQVLELASKMYGVDFLCPDGGQYELSDDGKTFRSTVHGTLDRPTQGDAPAGGSPVERLMRDFDDLSATLTFLPEGLRAVVVIDRK